MQGWEFLCPLGRRRSSCRVDRHLGLCMPSGAALLMPVVVTAMPCCAQGLPRVAVSCLCHRETLFITLLYISPAPS